MNEIREKVIKIIEDCKEQTNMNATNFYLKSDDIVDALISSGLIFNPETDIRTKFKIGQYVWFYSRIDEKIDCSQVLGWSDWGKGIDYALRTYMGSFLEKDIFATEAEAQAVLEEKKCQNQLKPKNPN